MLLIGCQIVCQLKYLWIRLELQHLPAERPSSLANCYDLQSQLLVSSLMVFGSQGLYQSNLIACGSQHLPCLIKTMASRSSLGVQWLRLHASAAGGTGLIPNAAQTKHKQKQNKANKQKSKLQKKTKSNGFLRRFEPPDCKPSKAPRPMVCSCT